MNFEPLHYGDRLDVLDPTGDIGVLTLWSDRAKVRARLEGADLSRVAVVANLYGNGMYAMWCNLLHNPQITHLVSMGIDRNLPICDEIEAFLANGVTEIEVHGVKRLRVVGTDRVFPFDPAFDHERLRSSITFTRLGRADATAAERFDAWVHALPAVVPTTDERIAIPITAPAREALPSLIEGHQVVRRTPLEAWRELVVRTLRFGRPVVVGGEDRYELLNTRVVITEPARDSAEALARHGFSLDAFVAYEDKLLSDDPPGEDVSYTYGNRLHGYFDQGDGTRNALASAISELRRDRSTRHAYVSLWDSAVDTPRAGGRSTPCLTTLFFRESAGALTLTSTYRVHNLLNAWLPNVYGLMAVQRHVAEAVGMAVGSLTIVSHSLGANPAAPELATAQALADSWTSDEDHDLDTDVRSLPEDPHGFFVIRPGEGEIVAEHWSHDGLLLGTFRGAKPERVEREIAGAMAVSLPSHAMWLGRQLALTTPRHRRPERPLVVLDIGSTLVTASTQHPARRIATALGLDDDRRRAISRALMTRPYRSPGEVAADLDLDAAVVAEVWEQQRHDTGPIPGAPEAFAALADAGVRLALLSNIWRPYLDAVERHYDFSAIPPDLRCYSFELGTMKPDPAAFRRVLAAAATEPADAVMVGDTYDTDLAPAIELGMRTIWVLERPDRELAHVTATLSGAAPRPDLTVPTFGAVTPDDLSALWSRT